MKKEKLLLKILPTVRNNLVKIKKYKRKLFIINISLFQPVSTYNGTWELVTQLTDDVTLESKNER
jgi:hypothetical protein